MSTSRRETLWTLENLKEALAEQDPVFQVRHNLKIEDVRLDVGSCGPRVLHCIARPSLKFPTPEEQKAAILKAAAKGAEACLTDLPLEEFDPGLPLIQVKDRFAALAAMADHARARYNGKLIGITGSFGKSTTKDMLGQMLAFFDTTFSTRNNYNEIESVQMHLASLPSFAKYAVLEVSMGRMRRKAAAIKKVDIGMLTAIGNAHGAALGDRSGILADKIKLLQTLTADGVAIVARDVIDLDAENSRYFDDFPCKILTVGEEADADIRLANYVMSSLETVVEVAIDGTTYTIEGLPPGRQFAFAAAFCMATAHALGLDLDVAAQSLGSFKKPQNQRGARWQVNVAGSDRLVEVLDDSQNSAPQSVEALMEYLALRKPTRKWLVLGDMLELGPKERELHLALVDPIRKAGITNLLTVGPLAKLVGDELAGTIDVQSCEDSAAAAKIMFRSAQKGDLIALKASGGVRLKSILLRMSKSEYRQVAPAWWLIEGQHGPADTTS